MPGLLLRKALLRQGLFLFLFGGMLGWAQSIYIDRPAVGTTLDDTQEFAVSILDATPDRVEMFLNGRLVQARKKPPFVFRTSWNTRFENQVKFVAYLPDGRSLEVSRTYAEITVDVETELDVFQFFPMVEKPDATLTVYAGGKQIEPQRLEPANTHAPLHLLVALDVSGSMKFFLDAVSAPLQNLMATGEAKGWEIRFLVFDSSPRQIERAQLPAKLADLYVGRASSIVYDALATGSQLFPKEGRRVLLLVSDGHDDGSSHDLKSIAAYLQKNRVALIWVNPTDLKSEGLEKLADRSGGLAAYPSGRDIWPLLPTLLHHQWHVVAPGVTFPVEVKASSGSVYWPKWAN